MATFVAVNPTFTLNRGVLIRLIADALIVNAALFVASVMAQFIVLPSVGTAQRPEDFPTALVLLNTAFHRYARATALLTPIAVLVYCLSGFYTFGRAYRSRYKPVVVAGAVTLTYGIFALLGSLNLAPDVSRSLWVGGWLMTIFLTEGIRVCSGIWTEVAKWEERLLRQRDDGRIHRLLVIGGAGYVGSALVRQLLRRGYVVRVLDVLLYGDRAMAELRSNPRFEFIHGDFRNIELLVTCMQDVDAVVHLGAIVGDSAGDLAPDITREVNVVATRLIAEIARGYGVRRFVFTSTCSVYGASDEFLDERSATNAVSLYAKSKLASEQILLGLTSESFSPVVLRFGTLYGLSYRPRFDLVVNVLVAKALLERAIMIVDGEQWRPFLHVEDAARAIVRCLEVPATQIAGQIFNVGGTEENYQLSEIAAMVCKSVPGTKVTSVAPEGPRRNYRVSCDKIKNRLGFRLTRTVLDGIAEVRAAIASGAITDYAASEYSNFKFLAAGERPLREAIEPLYGKLLTASGDR